MARRPRFKLAAVEAALRQSGGIFTGAALILKCAPNTVKNYVERSPKLQKVKSEVEEATLDLAENKLIGAMQDGNLTAVIFYLKCKGKSRGYVEKSEIIGPRPKVVKVDLRSMTTADLEKLAAWDADDEAGAGVAGG